MATSGDPDIVAARNAFVKQLGDRWMGFADSLSFHRGMPPGDGFHDVLMPRDYKADVDCGNVEVTLMEKLERGLTRCHGPRLQEHFRNSAECPSGPSMARNADLLPGLGTS